MRRVIFSVWSRLGTFWIGRFLAHDAQCYRTDSLSGSDDLTHNIFLKKNNTQIVSQVEKKLLNAFKQFRFPTPQDTSCSEVRKCSPRRLTILLRPCSFPTHWAAGNNICWPSRKSRCLMRTMQYSQKARDSVHDIRMNGWSRNVRLPLHLPLPQRKDNTILIKTQAMSWGQQTC